MQFVNNYKKKKRNTVIKMIERHRKYRVSLPGSSRRKWARRGRAITDFLAAILFTVAEHIVDFIILCGRRIISIIYLLIRKRTEKKTSTAKQAVIIGKEPIFKPINRDENENVHFGDVVGLNEAKQQIMHRIVFPLRYRDKAKILKVATGGGILLYGPPGVGKTMLAKAVANEINAVFFHIKPSDIVRQGVGAAEQLLSELFRIVKGYKLAVLFMDDIEGLLPSRSKNPSTIMRRIINQYLIETDGLESKVGDNILLILGATNEPEMMDPAIRRAGRFDEKIFIGLPDASARELILKKNMGDVPASDEIDFRHLAELSDKLSGADLKGLVDKAKQSAFKRSMDIEGRETVSPISMADLESAIESLNPNAKAPESVL